MHPFANLHRQHHGRAPNSSSSRHGSQQMALFGNLFPSMRLFDQDSFAGDFGGNDMGTISSFVSFGFVFLYIYPLKYSFIFF
jgi:hypothetical protein